MARRRLTIKMQILFWYTIIFTTAFLLFALIVMVNFTSSLKKTAEDNMYRELELITNSLDVLVSDCEEYLKTISTDSELVRIVEEFREKSSVSAGELLQTENEINNILSDIIEPNTKLTGASVVADGQILSGIYSINTESIKSILTTAYLNEIESSPKLVWGQLARLSFRDRADQMVFPVSKAIMNKETGKKSGIITVYLEESDVSQIYEKSNIYNNSYFIVENGIIISSSDKKLLNQSSDQIDQGDGWILTTDYEEQGWKIVCKTDFSTVNEVKTVLLRNNILILAAMLLVVFFVSYRTSARITKPLYSLLMVMKEIENGNIDARSDYPINDEFGILSSEFNKLIDEQQRAMNDIYESQKARRKSELLLLQSQIKPHFLYNTMETIASFIKLGHKELALETIQSLSTFYRKSLSMGKEVISVRDEVTIISEYLTIQSLRYKNYMEYSIDIEPGILEYRIPKLTLQPLVENSIYHGLKQKDEKGELIVKGYEQGEKLCFEVFDTGRGIEKQRQEELEEKIRHRAEPSGDGFGLCNVAERMRLFYGEDCEMQIDSVYNEYTQITIIIPKKKE